MLAARHESVAQQQPAPAPPTPGAYSVTPKPEDVKLKPEDAAAHAGVRVRAKGADGRPLARKRFFLLTRPADAATLDLAGAPARADYLKGASPELREWLARHDCDSLYCPEYEAEFASAKETVPELRRAYAEGLRRYRSPDVALRWLTVNFPAKGLRTDYYRARRLWLAREAARHGSVASVMTDEKGEGYFIGVTPGAYFVSNLLPLERGNLLWSAPVTVPPLLPGRLHSVSAELNARPK
jgi:hypothetical protein